MNTTELRHRSPPRHGTGLARGTIGALVLGALLGAPLPPPTSVVPIQTSAWAQDDDTADVSSAEKLAKEFSDPLTTLPQMFLQDAYTPSSYGTEAQSNRVIVRAIVPRIPRLQLLPLEQLVRPTFTLATVPTGSGAGTRTAFGDMQFFDAAIIPWPPPEYGLRMAVGPTFVFPTATDKAVGQQTWMAGPLFAGLYKGIPWLLAGFLFQNPISFAYTSPDAPSQSSLLFQPIALLSVGGGWYVKSADASWSIGWRHNTATTIPLSFGVGRVINQDGALPTNFFVTGEWMAYRQFAPAAPQTTVRFGVTVAFPQYRPW